MNSNPTADQLWKKSKTEISQNDCITKSSIFFDMFYGEEWVIPEGREYEFKNNDRPLGCLGTVF